MTNFNTATRSFDLCAEGTESYSWAWEGINRTETLAEIEATNNDIIAYAHGWACELCNACIDQISPEGERGFTAEEITHDLIVDRHALADALQAWLEGDDEDPEDDQDEDDEDEPLFVITHPMMGDWSDPATISEISADVAMNWRTAGVEYRVEAHGDNVYIYAMDSSSESNSRNWHGWLYLGFGEYRLEIGELYQPEEEGDDEPEDPQPIGVEVAVRLLEEGFIEEGAGIYINRANGHAGGYDISVDSDDEALYEVVWVHGINASHEAMTKEEVITLIREEAELGARFYWQVMDNNEWELTNAPYLQSLEVIEEDEETSDETYLGESTLAKIRRQKELVTNDREEMFPSRRTAPVPPVAPQTREGFFICTRSVEGGGTPGTIIYAFADEGDFIAQNPHWEGVELPAPRWHGVAVMDTTQPVEGGFQLAWGGWHDAPIHAPYIYKP